MGRCVQEAGGALWGIQPGLSPLQPKGQRHRLQDCEPGQDGVSCCCYLFFFVKKNQKEYGSMVTVLIWKNQKQQHLVAHTVRCSTGGRSTAIRTTSIRSTCRLRRPQCGPPNAFPDISWWVIDCSRFDFLWIPLVRYGRNNFEFIFSYNGFRFINYSRIIAWKSLYWFNKLRQWYRSKRIPRNRWNWWRSPPNPDRTNWSIMTESLCPSASITSFTSGD